MKLETLGKNNKRKILIGGLIGLSLVSVIGFTTTRAKYRSTQSIKLATGKVNFKSPDLNVVAINVSEDGTNYTNSDTLPEGNFALNEEKSKCRISTETLTGEKAPVDEKISIKYTDGKINVLGLTTRNTRCYLYFDKLESVNTVLGNLYVRRSIPNFTKVATSDEGIFETDDPMYATKDNPNPKAYYWRGAATTNYAQFANKCWRIIRINGDGTVRMIYDGSTCHANGTTTRDSIAKVSQTYSINSNTQKNSSYVGWTYTVGQQRPSDTDGTNVGEASGINTATKEWFNDNTNFTDEQREQVADGKFCNDRRTQNDENWRETGDTQYYAAYQRRQNSAPTLECLAGDTYTLKAGTITADDALFAGASGTKANENYYLYNGQHYWTMSPYNWDGIYTRTSMFIMNNTNGSLTYVSVGWTGAGVRPVINLKADITISSGNGTFDNPYIVQ